MTKRERHRRLAWACLAACMLAVILATMAACSGSWALYAMDCMLFVGNAALVVVNLQLASKT